MELSKKDLEILKLLQQDARLSTAAIAEKVNLSQSPCWRRISSYEESGLIKGKVHILDREKLGMDLVVFATVKLVTSQGGALNEFEKAVIDLPEVSECYTMTGIYDYMLKIIAKDIRHYEKFIRNHLLQLPNIHELNSHIAVTQIKDTTELPLDTQM